MSKLASVCLCAVMTFVTVCEARLLAPAPVLAASGVLTMETPLHQAPDPAAPLIALLPEGTVVSIDGPPVDGFYPVTAGALTGWMRGETLLLEKDPGEGSKAIAEPPPVDGSASGLPTTDQLQTGDPAAPADPATAGAEIVAPVADPAAPDPAAVAPDDSLVKQSPQESVDPAAVAAEPIATIDPAVVAAEKSAAEPIPVEATTAETGAGLETEVTPATAPDATGAEKTTPAEPPPDPSTAPAPAVTGPVGPASVTSDASIRAGPSPQYDLIFTAPQGSTVEQTGHVVDGYVTVRYKEVTGWLPLEHLAAPSDFAPEETPSPPKEIVDPKTPRPGSGVAYTTVDLSLRAGPSANEAPIVVVPAGSRVVLTGVMEGGFQRVTFDDQIGWVADEYLQTPADPEPERERHGEQQDYTRQQIVRIIYDAADRYGQSRSAMLRVAECESSLDPYAVNPSGSYGLFQFIRSTWKSTPFGDEDIFDPRANANAAGWMWAHGRKSEWVCQ
jgi:uncharacterized protein YraI